MWNLFLYEMMSSVPFNVYARLNHQNKYTMNDLLNGGLFTLDRVIIALYHQ